MEIVNVHEAKTHFSALIDRVHAGEEIVVAKAGIPWARLVPLDAPPPREPGRYDDDVPESFFEPLDEDELVAWNL